MRSSLLRKSEAVSWQILSPAWLLGSQTIPLVCALVQIVGMHERGFLENLQYQIWSQRTTHCTTPNTHHPICSLSYLPPSPHHPPRGNTHTFSPNFMHNCEHPMEMGWVIISCCAPFMEVKSKLTQVHCLHKIPQGVSGKMWIKLCLFFLILAILIFPLYQSM